MKPYYGRSGVMLYRADVMGVLRGMAADSFDACFCDPPYGLSFMDKEWDHGVPGVGTWREVYRVLKPGAMLLAFGGTRTHHRLMCAIEDAGFEIRDCLMWLYGSGFPKSLDISKAIDKAAGVERQKTQPGNPPAYQRSIGNTRPWMDDPEHTIDGPIPITDAAKLWSGYGTALKPAWEPIILAMKPCEGTFAENALAYGIAGLNIDAGRIGFVSNSDLKATTRSGDYGETSPGSVGFTKTKMRTQIEPMGRWPANLLLDEEAAGMLDEQSGITKSTGGVQTPQYERELRMGRTSGEGVNAGGLGDSGGASRFFYCAKASRSERGEGNNHPTVKPLKLCEYLARLILPPACETSRRLLIPFAGSGSEMIGAVRAGWDWVIGVEIEERYCEIAANRLRQGRF